MTMLCRKLLSGLLALTLLLSLAPAAMAEETRLQVNLTGLYPMADGTYQSVAASGVFDVYQDGAKIAALSVTPEGENIITLNSAGAVSLIPVMGSFSAEMAMNEYGYGVNISEGRLNIANIQVYANVEQEAVPTAELTAEPVVTPAPTAEATATPVPTEEPTAEPTSTPAPVNGTLTVKADGEAVYATYTIAAGESIVVQGELSDKAPVTVEALPQGEYLVTLTLADNMVLTALNGNATVQRGTAQWNAVVTAEQKSVYTVELTETGDLLVPFENVTGAKVMVKGERESFEITPNAEGVYEKKNVLPDEYTVTVQLPAGRYEYDTTQWEQMENTGSSYDTSMSFGVNRNCETELPLISRNITGSVGGKVVDLDGAAMKGVAVTIYDTNSQAVATAKTDKSGQWQIDSLTYGEYIAQYSDDKYAIPATSFTLDDANVDAKLSAAAEPPAKITIRVFVDENNNGAWNKGEGYLKGVEVSLVDENGAVVDTGLTAKDGYVTLAAPDGNYRVRASLPEDYGFGQKGGKLAYTESLMDESAARIQESDFVTLSTDKKVEAGIGVTPMAIVRGTVWEDVNADGIWQEDEPGIAGIRMTIEGGKDKALQETVTDENGFYEFRQVKKGNYDLLCYVPDEYVFTIKAKGDVEKISRMTTEKDRAGMDELSLDRGEVHENHNIGLMQGAIIEGVCFLDANYNGVFDEGEQPLPGVELRLARQSNNVLLQYVVSDENGAYRFVGQRGSTFTIRANLPKGSVFTVTAEGENGNKFAPNGEKTERRLTDVTLENGGYQKILLGAIQFGSISGRVYFDGNFSSDWESGEQLGNGNLVTLNDEAGQKVITLKADKNGLFTFDDLVPGTYYLSMKPEKGYAFTALGTNNVMQTLADGTGWSREITVGMGEQVENAGIGMIVPAVVSGVFFADDNDNGLQDAGEMGLKGAVVRLMGENGEAFAATIDGNGEYCFNAVLPGRYYLQYELPGKGVFAANVAGGNTITGENGVGKSDWFSVASGDNWAASLCGGVLLSDISGLAFADSDGSSSMDADEQLVSGLSITLTPTRSDLTAMTVVTGTDGSFAFSDLRPDTYTLTVECPGEYVISRLSGVEMPITKGLAKQENTFFLQMGTQWHEQMLGCVIPASWTGEAWLDENWDGLRAADEAPASGETVELRDAVTGETVFSVKTDENGVFTIAGIAPGEYELVYPLDEGNLDSMAGCDDFTKNGDVMTNGRVTIRENEQKSGTTLCVVRTTEIAGLVWLEEYTGVTPVQGAKLRLLDASGNAIAEYTTGEDGRYAFKGLMPGDYAVDVTIPGGYVLVDASDTTMAEKGLISFVEEAQGLSGKSAVICLRMAKHRLDMDAGMVLPGRLGDKAWLDLNGNGLQDGEEGGIPGVTIEVLRGEKVVATAVTDQYGYYTIKDLYPTEYVLRVTWPAEVKPTILREDIGQISSVLKEDGLTIPVTVESNKANYAADLGFVLVEEGKLPAGYGEGATQIWKKK